MIRFLGTIIGLAGREVRERRDWLATSLFICAISSFLALASAAALLVAMGIAVARFYGPLVGALSVAGLCILLSLALLIGWRIAARRHAKRMRRRRRGLMGPTVASLAVSALPLSRTPHIRKSLLVAAGLFAIGFLLASSGGEGDGDGGDQDP
ncbi:hypothetical protein HPQ64_09645 [Rhizobiales bacterium]|uniref:hypothetical protein n=1 Tax=Hongsoonwoonella zoysiae TaxID=2821844 RepID=UPI0015600A21|nr:hypothetical protein [Hongsoonwoonella zoysiae]NRG17949.1 hypothetical protein [Hongsoonwoonella zoysiae]